jgi:hypothetical protein
MQKEDFNYPNKKFQLMVESLQNDHEIYEANLESAIADIASDRTISNDEAFRLIQLQWQNEPDMGVIDCPHKNCQFWVEQVLG